jgi:hypothetical protein
MQIYIRSFLFPLLLLGSLLGHGQTLEVRGQLLDAVTGAPVPDGFLVAGDMVFPIQEDGRFRFTINAAVDTILRLVVEGYVDQTFTLSGAEDLWDLGEVRMQTVREFNRVRLTQEIPVIELTEADFDENATGNVSALLQASRDPFVRAAAFQFSAARFRIRGYESRYTTVLLNGVSANDPRNGDVFWSEWAGLNDVMRTEENLVGLIYLGDAMANMGGVTTFDTRAHRQRKQTRVSYAASNRTFTNRVMATHSTGWMKGGWALSVSGSRRWAQEGYIPGTFFDGYSYFLSVDKRLGRDHILNATVLGAPVKRGRSTGNTLEQYDLAGSNFYNPFWGRQEGKVRNSRVLDVHQPIAILRYDWRVNRNSKLMASFSWQDGKFGSSSLEWNGGRDPRAEYYRRWPSSVQDPGVADQMRDALREDESLRQVDWAYMYNANRQNLVTIPDANGIPGNSVTGLRSQYMVQEFRSDARTLQGRLVWQSTLRSRHLFSAGLQGQQMRTDYFKKSLDLLGGDFWLDIDRFAEFDFPNNPDVLQNDLDTPNRLITAGDRFGYDYLIQARNYQGWAQIFLSGSRLDGFVGGELGYADFYRDGQVRTGRFPENSLGRSEVLDFLTWKAKGGLTFKIDGRNYLSAAIFGAANAPDFQNGFISPRTRNDVVADLPAEKVYSGEISYKLQAPTFKFRVTGYVTEIRDQVNVLTFFNDLANTFGNYVLTGIQRRHIGTEWGADWKLTPALELNAAAALGQHYFTDRARATVIQDNTGLPVYSDRTVYIRNFRLDGMPQEAFSLGVTYNSRKFWYANLQLNYFRKSFLDFSPDRRTSAAVEGVEPGSPQWRSILDQEELPGAFMLNAFGGKSWKIRKTFLYLNVGVNNLLNNTTFRTGGFEQLRFDDESRNTGRFPNRYFYAFGLNYFVNLSVRI